VTGLEDAAVEGVVRPFKRRSRWLLPALLGALLLILILLTFPQPALTRLGESLVVSDPLEHADLIYVLAGDFWGGRVLLGARLGAQGWAPKVIVSGGLYTTGDFSAYEGNMAVDFAVKQGYSRSLFLPIPLDAQSTVEEARAIGPIFHRLGAKRIILVTSNFHSRRAAEVFRLFLPEFDFQMEAAADDAFDPRAWWKKPQQRRLLYSEYQKMIGTMLVRFHLANAGWLRAGPH
jgi:uncharacterized SAM-binding protein YcdF (DUF218 family)